jgi:hypothetical protein
LRKQHGRALVLLVLLLALLAGAGAWWYFAPETLPAVISSRLPASPKLAPMIYKWRDAKGQVHYTDTPPPDRPYEIVRYNPNLNVLPKGVAPSKNF